MRPNDFRKIEEYFKEHGSTAAFARTAFSKYIENVESSMNEQKNELNRELTEPEIRQICNNFLNPPIMRQYLDLSIITNDLEEKSIAKKYDKEGGLYGISKLILIGITYNFIFTILLILIFAAAKDQITIILAKLGIG